MKKEQYEKLKKMNEHDIPLFKNNNKFITPEKAYKENKPIIPQLVDKPDWELLEQRLEKKLEKGMLLPIYTMGGEVTPEGQLDAVKNKTAEGYQYMLAENGLVKYLLSLVK